MSCIGLDACQWAVWACGLQCQTYNAVTVWVSRVNFMDTIHFLQYDTSKIPLHNDTLPIKNHHYRPTFLAFLGAGPLALPLVFLWLPLLPQLPHNVLRAHRHRALRLLRLDCHY